MLAARLNMKTRKLSVEEMPTPHAGPGQVRIKVGAAGVCLSDVHLIQGQLTPFLLPDESVTLGHEVAGTIDEVGLLGPTEGGRLEVGQRVLLQAGEVRGLENWTRGVDFDGGWAEFAVARADTVVRSRMFSHSSRHASSQTQCPRHGPRSP